ncbi:hypothetical protein MMC34_005889 [Xylographa carneopallida]|nr:hypothetical protein [Xylographa carneopallida]
MGRERGDTRRLLDSTTSSDDGLDAFDSANVEHNAPHMPDEESADYSDTSSMVEYKDLSQYDRRSSMKKRFKGSWLALNRICYCLTLFIFLLLAYTFGLSTSIRKTTFGVANREHDSPSWVKPEGFKIVALIFCKSHVGGSTQEDSNFLPDGRPRYVSILDCYLKRNLAINGGYLDEVHWMANTENQHDLAYLDTLVNTTESYKAYHLKHLGFQSIWEHAVDNNTLYIKIDDDMIYIHEDAIPRLVQSRIAHPSAFDIAANIVNSPLTNWFHARTGAVLPYLPEPSPPHNLTSQAPTWRASSIPFYSTPADLVYDFGDLSDGRPLPSIGEPGGPTYKNHRWLPLPPSPQNLQRTPIARSAYDAFGLAWTSWAIAAQQHYSLLSNIESNHMHKYHFGDADGLWDMQYDRYNLNFIAIWGRDVRANLPIQDDEQELTSDIPRLRGRPLLVDTKAVVSHFSFGPQKEGMGETDLLARYEALAEERVCLGERVRSYCESGEDCG